MNEVTFRLRATAYRRSHDSSSKETFQTARWTGLLREIPESRLSFNPGIGYSRFCTPWVTATKESMRLQFGSPDSVAGAKRTYLVDDVVFERRRSG